MPTVFLYEDSSVLRESAIEKLQERGVTTIAAWDGINFDNVALPRIRELYAKNGRLALMIVDVWVEHGDGFSIARRLKMEVPQVEDAPLVIWTDSPSPELLAGWHLVQDHTPIDVIRKSQND